MMDMYMIAAVALLTVSMIGLAAWAARVIGEGSEPKS